MPHSLLETIDNLPNICGSEPLIATTTSNPAPVSSSSINFAHATAGFAIALHMHQPLIPAGSGDLATAPIISNLRHMFEHPEIPDAHNAAVFRWCYQRMGALIPQLLNEGAQPRIMLDYSGCLFHGLREMGAGDVLDSLKHLATDPACQPCVEFLGTAWGHAVAPSTPPLDFRRHVRAWQHHFGALFGLEPLSRVRGFSPPEMALPNHPEDAYAFVKTLRECGYQWVMVQEHSVESAANGAPIRQPHIPHRLVARNSSGQSAEIIAIVKTQGSDTKLVAQMQPLSEARTLSRTELDGISIPQLVTQIGDGENGGVMMNEFPAAFLQAMRSASNTPTPPMNITEYLEHLSSIGVKQQDFPAIVPIFQHRIWSRMGERTGSDHLSAAIEELRKEDSRFHVEGGSWTGDRSWVRGYESVMSPMQSASQSFAQKMDASPNSLNYRSALFHLLNSQTSCFRYWGQGAWTDYGKELCRRTIAIIENA